MQGSDAALFQMHTVFTFYIVKCCNVAEKIDVATINNLKSHILEVFSIN